MKKTSLLQTALVAVTLPLLLWLELSCSFRCFPGGCNDGLVLVDGPEVFTRERLLTRRYEAPSHEIEVIGDFGRVITRTENVPSPWMNWPRVSHGAASACAERSTVWRSADGSRRGPRVCL